MVAFRLSEKDKADLKHNAKELTRGNITEFLIQSIRKFKNRPELYNFIGSPINDDHVTKEDLMNFENRLSQQLSHQRESIQQMSQLIADQYTNGSLEGLLGDIKDKLLSYEKIAGLDTYQKVEEYLIRELPAFETEITSDRIYNTVLSELMQEGFLKYNIRSKMLKWRSEK